MLLVKEYSLSSTFEKRIEENCAGLLVDEFTGLPGTVTIRIREKTEAFPISRGLILYKPDPSGRFVIKNEVAQTGTVKLILASVDMLASLQLTEQANPSLVQGSVDVGTTATQLPDYYVRPGYTVVITANLDNTDPIYLGSSDVTIANGIRLDPGNSMTYTVKNTNEIYAIAAVTGQKLSYIIGLQPPQIVQKLNPTSIAQGQVAVGTTATQFPAQAVPPGIAVVVTADPGNTDAIYIGGSGVTTSTGQELLAGDSMQLWVNNVNAIYAIAAVTGQYARYIVEVA